MKRMPIPIAAPLSLTAKGKFGVAVLALTAGAGLGLIVMGILIYFERR